MKVHVGGRIVERGEATVSVLDHGLLYGDGLFEGMRSRDGVVFALEKHLARLERGARSLAIDLPGGLVSIRDIVERTLAADGGGDRYIRLVVTRGEGPLGLDPTTCPDPGVICIVDQVAVYTQRQRTEGLALVTSSFRRPDLDAIDPRIKSLNYLNNVQAKGEARRLGADDALMLNGRGLVAEASVANVFIARDGALLTPPTTDGCLEGITRATVIEGARDLGIPVSERSLGRADVVAADEAFMTGTGAGIVRIAALDGQRIGEASAALTERIMKAYADVTRTGGRAALAS